MNKMILIKVLKLVKIFINSNILKLFSLWKLSIKLNKKIIMNLIKMIKLMIILKKKKKFLKKAIISVKIKIKKKN